MLIKRPNDVPPSEITPKGNYENRRHFMTLAAAASLLGATAALSRAAGAQEKTLGLQKLENVAKSRLSTDERPTAYTHVTNYNNYYEFGTDKSDPAQFAGRLKVRPWSGALHYWFMVKLDVAQPAIYAAILVSTP